MEKSIQTIFMPDGTEKSFEECLDNVRHTRDYSLYLDSLLALSGNYMIAASVNDNYGRNIPDDILEKLHNLGLKMLMKSGSQRYIYCEISEETPSKNAFFEAEINGVSLSILSNVRETDETNALKADGAVYLLRNEARSEIKVNGEDYSLNCSGLNIIVYDYETNTVVDSSTYDFALSKPTFYHKNFDFDEKYFDTHFFLKRQYSEFWRRIYRKSYYSNQKLRIKEVVNGIILPVRRFGDKYYGGICDENFNFIYGIKTFTGKNVFGFTKHVWGGYTIPKSDVDYIDEEVVYVGWFFDHPGHLIDECISLALWYVAECQNPDLKIAVRINPMDSWWPETTIEKFYFSMQFFSAMGIPGERIIVLNKPTQFKKVIVPEQSFYLYDGEINTYSFTNEFILPYKRICELAKPTGYSKVYFSKRKSAYSNFLGEDYFIDFFRKKGFAIIDPEDYSISEKVGILRDADEFVMINGSSQNYAVFCKPSAKIVILQRDNACIWNAHTLATSAAGINNIYIIDVSLDFIHQSIYGNVNLIGVTGEWIRYVKEVYDEEVDITTEDYLKSHMFEYLGLYPKYYFKRQDILDTIKNFRATDMLRNISEVLLGEELDTNGLDLRTQEDILREKCEQNETDLDFLKALFHDMLSKNKLSQYLCDKNCISVGLLCGNDRMTSVFKDIFAKLSIKLCFVGSKTNCGDLSDDEWEQCKKSNLILRYDSARRDGDERDGISVVNIYDIVT